MGRCFLVYLYPCFPVPYFSIETKNRRRRRTAFARTSGERRTVDRRKQLCVASTTARHGHQHQEGKIWKHELPQENSDGD